LGISSTVTRTDDSPLRVGDNHSQRINKVKNSGAKYALSHHYNGGGGNGGETIYSMYSDGKLANMIIDEFKSIGHPVRRAFTKTGKDGKDYYYMHRLRGAVDVTIVEYDFLDNKSNNNIVNKEYRFKLYEAVVRACCKFHGIKYKGIGEENMKPKIIITGGIKHPQAIVDISNYMFSHKYHGYLEYGTDGNAHLRTSGLSGQKLADFEAWLKERGWWYRTE
jgi:hypothetical protein